jgi:hypothetical protein
MAAIAATCELHHPKRGVEDLWIAAVGDQPGARHRQLEERHLRGFDRGCCGYNRVGRSVDDAREIGGIDAAHASARSPQAHQVGRRVVVRGCHDEVVEAGTSRDQASDGHDVVVKEPDGIERDDSKTMRPVVDH